MKAMKRVLVLAAVAGLLFSGCGAKKDDAAEGSNLNVPGKGGAAKTADLNGMEQAFRDRYVAQCRQQLSMGAHETGKTPDEICNCVGDKIWGMSKHAANTNQELDPMVVQQEMMACMGIDMNALNEDMFSEPELDESVRHDDPGSQNRFSADENGPPQLPEALQPEDLHEEGAASDTAAPPTRQANRNYKYDPKTGQWSN